MPVTERVPFTPSMAASLAYARHAKGISQRELAARVGAPRASVKRWECAEVRTIERPVLERIENELGSLYSAPRGPQKRSQAPSDDPPPKAVRRRRKGPRPFHAPQKRVVLRGRPSDRSPKGKLHFYEIEFEHDRSVGSLLGAQIRLDLGVNSVAGVIRGVESSKRQSRDGIRAGEKVVIAVFRG